MQRLFSTFPNGWPGTGLLVLRMTVAYPLLSAAIIGICAIPHSAAPTAALGALVVGALLVAGFCTPYAAAAQIMIQTWATLHSTVTVEGHLVLAAISLSLIMTGPGALSVDGRLFGRKRIDLGYRGK